MPPSLDGADFDESEHQLRSDELLVHATASQYSSQQSKLVTRMVAWLL